jgi:hypothetical protein
MSILTGEMWMNRPIAVRSHLDGRDLLEPGERGVTVGPFLFDTGSILTGLTIAFLSVLPGLVAMKVLF